MRSSRCGSSEQRQRRLRLRVGERRHRRLRLARFARVRVLQLLQLEQHLPDVRLDHVLLGAELLGRLLHDDSALPRAVDVQRVHVKALAAARGEEVYAQAVETRVAGEAAHTVLAIAESEAHLVTPMLGGESTTAPPVRRRRPWARGHGG